MTKPNLTSALATVLCCLALLSCAANQQNANESIRAVLDKYVRAVDNADTDLARQVWAEDADISFIHPMGHERGWTQIKSNFYEKLMRDMLSKRKLATKDMVIKNYGNTALVEFYWVFDATLRHNGQSFRSQGRESQVLRRSDDGVWRIAHVHYSGMPAAIPGQGL